LTARFAAALPRASRSSAPMIAVATARSPESQVRRIRVISSASSRSVLASRRRRGLRKLVGSNTIVRMPRAISNHASQNPSQNADQAIHVTSAHPVNTRSSTLRWGKRTDPRRFAEFERYATPGQHPLAVFRAPHRMNLEVVLRVAAQRQAFQPASVRQRDVDRPSSVTKMEDGGNLLLSAPASNDQGTLPLNANNLHAILA
jgi:hypothetical protein